MKFQTTAPPPELAKYVRFFWVLECDVAPEDYYIHRSTADGCTELIFHYKGCFNEVLSNGDEQSSFVSGIHGQSRAVRRFQISEDFGIFGVYLYPYAIPHLFGIPASDTSDQMIDMGDFLGEEGRVLESMIMYAASSAERVEIACRFLLSRLSDHRRDKTDEVVRSIIDHKGFLDIERVASECFLSRRQFERRFRNLTGYSPRLYARILRFQSVFEHLGSRSHSLAQVAYLCGYADQSHFIHDFKEFSGYNPGEFLRSDSTETIIWTDTGCRDLPMLD